MVLRKSMVKYLALSIMAISLILFVLVLDTFYCNMFICYSNLVSYSRLSDLYVLMIIIVALCAIMLVWHEREYKSKIYVQNQNKHKRIGLSKYIAIAIIAIGWISYIMLAGTFSCNADYSYCHSNFVSSYGELGGLFILMASITILCAVILSLSETNKARNIHQYNKEQRIQLIKEKSKRIVYIVLALLMILAMWSVLFVQNEALEGSNHYTDDYLNSSAAIITLVFLALSWNKKALGDLITQDRAIAVFYLGAIVFQVGVIMSNLPFSGVYAQELLTDEIPGLLLALFVYVNIYR